MGGGHGILEGPGDLAVGYRRWGGVMGYWRDLGIWLSGIGGGGGHGILEGPGDLAVGYRRWGGSWDTGETWRSWGGGP